MACDHLFLSRKPILPLYKGRTLIPCEEWSLLLLSNYSPANFIYVLTVTEWQLVEKMEANSQCQEAPGSVWICPLACHFFNELYALPQILFHNLPLSQATFFFINQCLLPPGSFSKAIYHLETVHLHHLFQRKLDSQHKTYQQSPQMKVSLGDVYFWTISP